MTMLVTQHPMIAYGLEAIKIAGIATAGGIIGVIIGGLIKGTYKDIKNRVNQQND